MDETEALTGAMQSPSKEAVALGGRKGTEGAPGITLVELAIIAAIIATLAGIGFPAYTQYRENARVVQTISDVRAIEHDLYIYEGYEAKLPDSLDEIGRGDLLDPWGNPYEYLNATTKKGRGQQRFDKLFRPLNTDFDLYSLGKDGETKPNLDKKESLDDIVRALNGEYVDLASEF